MIEFENTEVIGWEHAIRGMRNPLNSWKNSDSYICNCEECLHIENDTEPYNCNNGEYSCCIGRNDMNLMKKLRKAGSDHRKYLRMICVYVDIIAPLYWWKEFDTYKVGTVANSCSTMHKVQDKEFTWDDFSCEHLTDFSLNNLKDTIEILNMYRDKFNETKDKKCWWQMIQILPTSYNQRRTVMLNYEVLNNMYHSRKNHKLDEWSVGFIEWVKILPYAKELITGDED